MDILLLYWNVKQQILQLQNCNNRGSDGQCPILRSDEKVGFIICFSNPSILCQCLKRHFRDEGRLSEKGPLLKKQSKKNSAQWVGFVSKECVIEREP